MSKSLEEKHSVLGEKLKNIELLNLVYQALKLGGNVLIGTPNAQSLFGASTTFIDFTHEQGFTSQSLSQILQVGNFEDVYVIIERGTGRGLWKRYDIFEPRIFAIAKKPQEV